MKLFARRIACGVVLPALLIVSACGDRPSFTEKESTLGGRRDGIDDQPASGDATEGGVIIGPNGEKIVIGPNGEQIITTPDGETIVIGPDGKPIVQDPTGPGGDNTDGDVIPGDGGKPGDKPGKPDPGKPGSGDDEDKDPDQDDKPRPIKKQTRAMTFPAQTMADAEATQDLAQAHLSQTTRMQRLYTEKTKTSQQITRPMRAESFTQGHTGTQETEAFDQIANRALDILMIIDDSESMAEEQANLASKLAPLLSLVEASDWRIGVVVTDPEKPCLRSVINKGDANYAQKFAQAVSAGANGGTANNERGILTGVRALAGNCATGPWLRDNSTIAVVVVSDEDNCSDGTACPNKAYNKPEYMYDYLAAIRQPGENARVYGIFWHPSHSQAQCRTGYNKANQWAKLVDMTKGTWGSICDADYTPTLRAVSQDLKVVLNTRFTLKQTPDSGSVRVFVDNVERTTGFTVMGKVVELNPAPAEGARITISYRHGAQPVRTAFPLQFRPLAGTVSVKVNGATVSSSSYTVYPNVPSIEFAAAPVQRAAIEVTYTRDVPLLTQFPLGDEVKAGTLLVTVDGMGTTDFTVLPGGIVSFPAAPAEGVTVTFAYVAVGAPVLRYPFVPLYDPPTDLVAFDTATGQPLRYVYEKGWINFFAQEFVEDREVTLRYDNVARQRFTVTLPNTPVANSVTAVGGQVLCAGAPYIKVQGRDVNVDGCGFADDLDLVTVRYKYVIAARQEFTFDAPNLPADGDWQEWKVYVNGRATTDYTRSGNVIRFPAPLPMGATVKIELIQEVW